MGYNAFIKKVFRKGTMEIIALADQICREMAQQGYVLTLRQLYYQFVQRNAIENRQSEYDRLGAIVSDARQAGHLNWDHIEDRGRNLLSLPNYADPSECIRTAASRYYVDMWENQPMYVETWVEKQALENIVNRASTAWRVPFLSCKGYMSISEMKDAGERLRNAYDDGKQIRIIHLGDHDPSGLDMTRDIAERLSLFMCRGMGSHMGIGEGHVSLMEDEQEEMREALNVNRIALNYNQVQQHHLPANPAKMTDCRADEYVRQHGSSSWELDALNPSVIEQLIRIAIQSYVDNDIWQEDKAREEQEKEALIAAANRWEEVQGLLSDADDAAADDALDEEDEEL